jgi:hypothetical protein
MEWTDLTKEEQKTLARAAVSERRTLIERWRHMGGKVSPGWDERARIAAGFIPPARCVIDVGCGEMMSLERHLPEGTRYIPVDVARRDDRTVVVDLNFAPLPDLGADYAVALGLLDYLYDVPRILGQIPFRAVISYSPVDRHEPCDRAESGWANAYTVDGLERLFHEAGFQIADLRQCPGKQMIWNLLRDR